MSTRLGRFLRWQRVPIDEVPLRAPRFEATVFTGYAIAYALFAFPIGWLVRNHPARLMGSARLTHDLWYIVVFKLAAMLGASFVGMRALGYRFDHLLPRWRWGPRSAFGVALAFAAGLALNVQYLPGIGAALRRLGAGEAALRLGLGALLPLVMAGIPEELAFRGLLQTRLEATLGRAAAVVVTALLFTAWHLPPRFFASAGVEGSAGDWGSVLLGTGVPVLLVGLVFGLAWDRYRSLPHLIAAHWGIDLLPGVGAMCGVLI